MKSMPVTGILAAVCALGLAACGESGEGAKKDAGAPAAGKTSDCCKQTEEIAAQIPPCCVARLDGGELSDCCKKSMADPSKKGPCCTKAEGLIAKVPECCLKAKSGEKPVPDCCKEMAK